jgi:hypothetical protein
MASILSRNIAVDLATAVAVEKQFTRIINEIITKAKHGFYDTIIRVDHVEVAARVRSNLDVLGYRTALAGNELTISWENPFPAVDKSVDNSALEVKQATRESLERNLDEVVHLVNKDIEAAASNGYFTVDFYSLSIYQNNIQNIINVLNRGGYAASHSGSYLHISWEA